MVCPWLPENFLLSLYFFKNTWKLQKLSLAKKKKPLHKYYPGALRTAFSIKFLLDAKVQNSDFWNISNLGLCGSSVDLNMSFKSKWDFPNTKIYRKFEFHGVWVALEMKICFLRQSWKKIVDKFPKLSKIDICLVCSTVDFLQSSNTTVQIWLWVAGEGPGINFKLFRNFFGIS